MTVRRKGKQGRKEQNNPNSREGQSIENTLQDIPVHEKGNGKLPQLNMGILSNLM